MKGHILAYMEQNKPKRKNMKTESQVKMIFDYLMGGCKITGLEAIKLFGSIKLSNRIGDIENHYGVTVAREWIEIQTIFGKKRVMQYYVNPGIGKRRA